MIFKEAKPYYCQEFVVLQLFTDGEKFMNRAIVWFGLLDLGQVMWSTSIMIFPGAC
jgi:hypothetical protein